MSAKAVLGFSLAVCLGVSLPAAARDAFEDGPGDNSINATTNDLNIDQIHDLEAVGGVADEDWYRYFTAGKRSYEIRAWAESGEIDFSQADSMAFFLADGTPLLPNPTGNRGSVIARWIDSSSPTTSNTNRLRIRTGQTSLTADARYRIEWRETTYHCPRYNNSGTQSSVLIIQHLRATTATCNVEAHFFNQDTGLLVGTHAATLTQNNMLVIPAGSVTGVAGTRGHARIAHTCGNNGLKAKLVALEPSTGFSFDTICEPR